MNYNIIPDLPFKFKSIEGYVWTATELFIKDDGWVMYLGVRDKDGFTLDISAVKMMMNLESGHWKIIKEENTMNKIKTTELKGFVGNTHQPYTDYNQDIADWLTENTVRVDFDRAGDYIFTAKDGEFYSHNHTMSFDKYYTNEEFKEWIGMTKKEEKTVNKGFTKADLKDGMICTIRGGYIYTVQGDRMTREGGMYILLEDISDDLTVDDLPELDIVSIQITLTVFERVDEKQLAIQKELEFAKAKAERLAAHISVLESKLK